MMKLFVISLFTLLSSSSLVGGYQDSTKINETTHQYSLAGCDLYCFGICGSIFGETRDGRLCYAGCRLGCLYSN